MATRGKLERDEAFQRFYALVDCVPRGRVATYGQIAREAGLPRHARHVGRALRELPMGSELPWHRILNARGEIARRPGDDGRRQRARLRAEGIEVGPGDRVSLRRFGWAGTGETDEGGVAEERRGERSPARRARSRRPSR